MHELDVRSFEENDSEWATALEVIGRMPPSARFEDVLEEIKILIALREAEEDIAAGRVIPHEEVMRIVASWCSTSSERLNSQEC